MQHVLIFWSLKNRRGHNFDPTNSSLWFEPIFVNLTPKAFNPILRLYTITPFKYYVVLHAQSVHPVVRITSTPNLQSRPY